MPLLPDVSVCGSTPNSTPIHTAAEEANNISEGANETIEGEDRILVKDDNIENFGLVWCFEVKCEGGTTQRRRVREGDFDRSAGSFQNTGEYIDVMICVREQNEDTGDGIILHPVTELMKALRSGSVRRRDIRDPDWRVDPKYQVASFQLSGKINKRILNAIERSTRGKNRLMKYIIEKEFREACDYLEICRGELRRKRRRELRRQEYMKSLETSH